MPTAQKVRDLILARIDFNTPAALAVVEKFATATADLANAGNEFDDVNPNDASATVAQGALDLADAFAAVATPDKNEFVKKAFNEIYAAATPEQEAAGEALFSAALDFNIAANALNALLTTSDEA